MMMMTTTTTVKIIIIIIIIIIVLLRAGRPRDRIPVGTIFSALVQANPEVYPAFYVLGTGLFPGLERPGRDMAFVCHLHLAPKLKK
jgi:hypothetical protein